MGRGVTVSAGTVPCAGQESSEQEWGWEEGKALAVGMGARSPPQPHGGSPIGKGHPLPRIGTGWWLLFRLRCTRRDVGHLTCAYGNTAGPVTLVSLPRTYLRTGLEAEAGPNAPSPPPANQSPRRPGCWGRCLGVGGAGYRTLCRTFEASGALCAGWGFFSVELFYCIFEISYCNRL